MSDITRLIETFINEFVVKEGYKNYLEGLKNTAIIAVVGLLAGLLLGSIIAIIKVIPSKNPILVFCQKLCDIYVVIFRGTPMVVQLLLLHFALFPMLGINIDGVAEASLIFGFNSGAYMSEVMRGGINSVDKGQMEAGRSLGFGFAQTMIRIIIPQAVKNILPTIGNEFIALIKETSVVSFIAVMDIKVALDIVAGAKYEYFIPYTVLALTYLVIVLFITWLIHLIERRLNKSERK